MSSSDPTRSLEKELSTTAWESARNAMEHYSEVNLRRFVSEAARTIELGGKALLARIAPVLIADPRHIDSQLFFAGHALARAKSDRSVRTISCREVVDRLSRILPALRASEIMPIIDARDGSTHYVVGDREALELMVLPFLAAVSLIQRELRASDAEVFGTYFELVESLREAHARKVDRAVAAKLARAKQAFADRYGGLEAQTRLRVIQVIRNGYVLMGYDEQIVTCPACEQDAIIGGQHVIQGWHIDEDEDGPYGRSPDVTLSAHELRCGVCGLHLEDVDELEAAGLETSLEVEDAREEDFVEGDDEYYPEDDLDR